MRYLTKYKIFESSSEVTWSSTEDEVKEHFYEFEDNDSEVKILKFWLSEDLQDFSREKRAGFYPGFIVDIVPKFKSTDIPKYIEYLKDVNECNSRLPNYYDPYHMISIGTNPHNAITSYRFTFLDRNWKDIHWNIDEVYKSNFIAYLSSAHGYQFAGSSRCTSRIIGDEFCIVHTYTQPISKVKSDRYVAVYKDRLSDKFPDYDIVFSEDTMVSTGVNRNVLVKSVKVECRGKKK